MRFLILLCVLLVAGCENPFGPKWSRHIPDNAYRIDPPDYYRELWRQVETETGMRGNFGAVTWYIVPGESWMHDGYNVHGIWIRHSRALLMAEGWACDPRALRHEMLHALGNPGHDHPLFSTPEYNVNIRS